MFVAFTTVQVLWVRFLPPLTTLTIESRRLESILAGKGWSIDRSWVDRDEVSDAVVKAVLAGEDYLFWDHHGFDWKAIRKAREWNARPENKRRGRLHGASTLTQQVAKNVFLWQGRSWLRKGLEAWYTALLELLVPKERILVLYLNVAEWGDRVFGVEAACLRTFKKHAKVASRHESAVLASSLPNPRKYPPWSGADWRTRREAKIAGRMASIDAVDPDEDAKIDADDDE